MGLSKILGWSAFVALVVAVGYLALRACVLSLPFVGPVITRCPVATYADLSGDLNAETQVLLDQLDDLQLASANVSQCPAEPALPIENVEIPEAEQVVVILDTSGSMSYPILPSARYEEIAGLMNSDVAAYNNLVNGEQNKAAEERMATLKSRIDNYRAQLEAEAGSSPRRMAEAKRAIRGVLEDPPGGRPVSLWGFGECSAPANKLYPAPPRSAAAVIDAITADGGTPLGDTIGYIPSMLEPGVGQSEARGVNVVLFSDGLNSCGADPCEQARMVKATHPFVWIHVVNLVPNLEGLSCVASSTGGVQVDGNNSAELTRILRYVAQAG